MNITLISKITKILKFCFVIPEYSEVIISYKTDKLIKIMEVKIMTNLETQKRFIHLRATGMSYQKI